ncbi:Six-hairpin glycosidase [Acephala macrosclerotiorum]|nr:Six-hairpin glycosidase [Acephala macrosclerotiorum]
MFTLAALVTLGAIISERSVALAAGCWRNTACTGPTSAAFPGAWDKYNYSPTSRTVSPESILSASGEFISDYTGPATLKLNGSQLIFDFGKEVAGIVTVSYGATGTGNLGLAFTEAKNWTGEWSDSSNGSFQPDGYLLASVTTTSEANYTMPDPRIRGGFRYLTLFSEAATEAFQINIQDITVEIAYQPSWSNLRAYQGYFSCSDDLLNRIWYSGAYTLQTNAIPPATGREFPILGGGWMNDQNLDLDSTGDTIYVDGSKRDRTVWPGDLGIAVPSILVSTGDWEGVANTLTVLYNDQQSSGELPFAGPGINIYGSDTYHMATLIGTYDYFLWTNDKTWLTTIYPKYKSAMEFITAKIDSTGMLSVTGTNDWGRLTQGGHNTEANMLLYKVLTSGSQIATWAGDSNSSSTWSSQAANLKAAVNANNYAASVGAFKDDDTDTTLYPEDANSMALVFGGALPQYVQSISQELTKNWISIGAVAPELPGNLVGFTQSFEIKAHMAARQATRGLELIRRAWGWYINNPYGTASTCIEGYLSDGSFGYRATTGYDNDYSYTSHAHGWGTGPTDALTSYIVGLTVTAPGGSQWSLSPQFGDLTHAEAGFTTPMGKFSASWSTIQGGYTVSWGAPGGTQGVLVLPASTMAPTLVVDGQSMALQQGAYNSTAQTVTISGASGSHTVNVTY